MLRNNYLRFLKKRLGKMGTALCFVVVLVSLIVATPGVSAEFSARIVFDPVFGKYVIGDNFTLTVNLTNFQNLHTWQVAFKYNATILNVTSIWVPPENVFAGHTAVEIPPPVELEAAGDEKDHLNWTMFGSTLLGDDLVTVTNGVLLKVNFTVINTGEATVNLATASAPIYRSGRAAYWSDLIDSDLNSYDIYILPAGCKVLVGVGNAAPTASFTILPPPPEVNSSRYYIVDGNVPPGVSQWVRGYRGFPVVFNASESVDPDGYITQYIWDFGDGNRTIVNTTGPGDTAAAVISHVYQITGPHNVRLTVVDNGNPNWNPPIPPASSPQSAPQTVLVGLLLDYYDWSPLYDSVGAVVAVLIVLYAARQVLRFNRGRRARMQAKMTGRSPNQPLTGTKT
jgi:hypothetical protein